MDLVKLETAFTWRCPTCKIRNFSIAVDRELTDDEREYLIENFGSSPGDFDLVGAPSVVTCSGCVTKFKTCDE